MEQLLNEDSILRANIQEQNVKLTRLNLQNRALSHSLNQKDSLLKEYATQTDSLIDDNIKLQDQLFKKADTASEYTDRLRNMNGTINNLEKQNNALNKQIKKKDSEQLALKKENETLYYQVKQKDNSLKKYELHSDSLREYNLKLQDQIFKNGEANSSIKIRLADLETENSSVKGELRKINAQNQTLKREGASLQSLNDAYHSAYRVSVLLHKIESTNNITPTDSKELFKHIETVEGVYRATKNCDISTILKDYLNYYLSIHETDTQPEQMAMVKQFKELKQNILNTCGQ